MTSGAEEPGAGALAAAGGAPGQPLSTGLTVRTLAVTDRGVGGTGAGTLGSLQGMSLRNWGRCWVSWLPGGFSSHVRCGWRPRVSGSG